MDVFLHVVTEAQNLDKERLTSRIPQLSPGKLWELSKVDTYLTGVRGGGVLLEASSGGTISLALEIDQTTVSQGVPEIAPGT